jgi:hypothetical protein
MQFTELINVVLFLSNIIFIVLYIRGKKQTEPTDSLHILTDLLKRHRVLVELKRIEPGQVFLRSPKDVV